MKPDKAFRSNQQVLRSSINKRSTITRRSSWKPEKSAPAPKNKQFKRRLDISQAINEALDDYTAEHVDEYSRYQKELIPRPTIRKEKPSEAEKPSSHKKSKRTHSFDIQTHKSPVLSAKKTPPVHDELPPLESLSLHVKVKSVGPTEEDFANQSETIYRDLFKGGSTLPTKSLFSVEQEKELKQLLLKLVRANGSLPGTNEESVLFYFSNSAISRLLDALRYENPYGLSIRSSVLEALARYDMRFHRTISHGLHEYLLQYVMDERGLRDNDDDFATIQQQIGGIHRYVMLLRVLTDLFRQEIARCVPSTPQEFQQCLSQVQTLLKSVESLLRTRSGVSKYAGLLSSVTISLFSLAPSQIASFYSFLLQHWPLYNSEKIVSFIDLLENLLASSPPLNLTPFLRDIARKVFKKVCHELLGSHLVVSKRATYFLQNYYLRSNYIAMDDVILTTVKKTLNEGMDHWNEVVAMACDKAFDMILDAL